MFSDSGPNNNIPIHKFGAAFDESKLQFEEPCRRRYRSYSRGQLCTVIPLMWHSISLLQYWVDFQSWTWWFFNHISSSPSFQNVSRLMQSIWIFQRFFIELGPTSPLQALILCWSGCRLGYELLWGLARLHPERPWQRLVFRRVLINYISKSSEWST